MSAGSFSGFGTESNLISGTACCAGREELSTRSNPIENFIRGLVYRKTLREVSRPERIRFRMQKRLVFFVVLACIIGMFAYVHLRADQGGITWLSDYREAVRLAKQTHQPMLVEFRCEA